MPHIEQPLQLTIFFYKSQQIQKVNFLNFYLKSWNTRKHTHRNLT